MVQPASAPLGTEQNPVKLALIPATDPQKVLTGGEALVRLLQRETGLRVRLSVPTSYAAVIEAMGTDNVDVGWLAPFAYVLAHDRVGAQALLGAVRVGSTTSVGQIVVRSDSGITSLHGLRGKRFAFVEPTSITGYLFPSAFLQKHGIDPAGSFGATTFAGSHEQVILAVYDRRVDGGATFGDGAPGGTADARTTVQARRPDVFEKVQVIARTDPIPNPAVSVRKGIPPELIQQLRDVLLRVAASPAGAEALGELYRIEGLAPAEDADFEPVREATRLLDLDLDAVIAPGRPPLSP
jgi:phosphonate transport system substrate-binding protein